MKRRDFVKALGLAGCSSLVPGFGVNAFAGESETFNSFFQQQLAKHPILKGWEGLNDDIAPRTFSWQGSLPEALIGKQFYRNGPALVVRNDERYTHWFDGDGFVHRYGFDKQGVTHSGKFVRTKKYKEESRVGKFLYNGAGSVITGSKLSKSAEAVNTANIALLPVDNELWALWEAAMPYKVDANTLETQGQVSLDKTLDGVPFSAHPHTDRFGHIWNFGDLSFFGESAIIVYQMDAKGLLLNYGVVEAPQSYVHDFAVTDDYLIFYFPPIAKSEAETLIDSMSFHGNEPGELLVIDKSTLKPVFRRPFDAGFVFHFGNAWQQGNTLAINACWYENADIILNDVKTLAQHGKQKHHRSTAAQIHIDLAASSARLENTAIPMEFVQFDGRFTGTPTTFQFGVHANADAPDGEYNAVARIDTKTGSVDSYSFGKHTLAEEPLFVPTGAQEGQGYLVNTCLDFRSGHTYCNVFDAMAISNGPVAQAKIDTYMPLGFHGAII